MAREEVGLPAEPPQAGRPARGYLYPGWGHGLVVPLPVLLGQGRLGDNGGEGGRDSRGTFRHRHGAWGQHQL